jgi:ABC-type transporter Mla subunit MlaD
MLHVNLYWSHILPSLAGFPWYVDVVFFVLGGLTLAFLAFFCFPAWRVGRTLRKASRALARPELAGARDLTPAFDKAKRLRHPWHEFRGTLHEERMTNVNTGVQEVVTLRATVPAETYFTEELIVNSPLSAEFFKHVPGIFTGFGIIGTFLGLLFGLRAFRVTDDPLVAHVGLETLVHRVSDAFVVSASAIVLAMLVTLVEKIVLVRLYSSLQRLTQAIDERFKAGVGEEYLSRLVGATEESAAQSKILKDALVGDLKAILTELSERQISAFANAQRELGQHISESVAAQLKQPLDRLAAVTETVRGDQGAAVQQMMGDLLARFTDRLEGLLGGQISGMQSVQQQMVQALHDAVVQLQQMSKSIEGAGQKASETLTERLAETLHRLDQRQLVVNEEMRKFVHEIRSLVGESQAASHHELQRLLTDLARQASSLVGDLSQKSQTAVGAMGSQVDGLARRLAELATQTAAAVQRLESVTTEAVRGLNSSAETLAIAADDFARAGQGVSGALVKAEALSRNLTESATSLTTATRSMDSLLAEYRQTRDAVGQMLSAVQSTVEAARREASMTADVLQRLNEASTRLSAAQRAADEYLEQVTNVLQTSHQAFAESMKRTLDVGNREFFDQVSTAIKLLRETILELEQTVGGALPRAGIRGR